VEVERFANLPAFDGAYFLIVSRFEAYKRIDLAIEACRGLRVPLRIIGSGVDEPRLRRLAAGASEVRFLGSLSDQEMATQLAGCHALLLPGEEDFGLIAVEAQAAGKPVIAYGEGGALETVLPDITGTFFHELSAEALAETLATFDPDAFDPSAARANAARYAPERFREHLRSTVETLLQS
jgi:glycosyltransferase involved in cell wall biosynthesis